MKRFLTFFFLLFTSIKTLPQHSGKEIIDTNMIEKWPYLNLNKPTISPNGDFAVFVISNQPVGSNTLIVQHTKNKSNSKSFVVKSISDEFYFSNDSKYIIWTADDTFSILNLATNRFVEKRNVNSVKYPWNNKGTWVAYKPKNSDTLVLNNIIDGKRYSFSNVTDYQFHDKGKALIIKTVNDKDAQEAIKLEWFGLETRKGSVIWSSNINSKISGLTFDKDGDQIVFIAHELLKDSSAKNIWHYKIGEKKAKIIVTEKILIDSGRRSFSIGNSIHLSRNGKWIFFELTKKETDNKSINSNIEIWSYKDVLLPPLANKIKKRSFTAAWSEESKKVIFIDNDNEEIETPFFGNNLTADFVVVRDQRNRIEPWWPHLEPSSYWLIDLKNGSRIPLRKNISYALSNFSFSPKGRWLVFWDPRARSFISYDLVSQKSFEITKSIPPVTDENYTSIDSIPVSPLFNWYSNDSFFIVYDRFDIWKIDPEDKKKPFNVTNGYGVRNFIKLRILREQANYYKNNFFNGNETLLLAAFNITNKDNGFFEIRLNVPGDPRLKTMGPFTYFKVESQKPHGYSLDDGMEPIQGKSDKKKRWLLMRSSATDFPNYFITEDFKEFKPLTNFQPQKRYNWLTSELISYKQLNGLPCEGILYKPENFDPSKKYPVIFNYYEKLSHRLHEFPPPALTEANINIPWFVSRGYLVFTPDIHYSIANSIGGTLTGESAYNSIVGAAQYLAKLPFVNAKKMGIQGHSFGGGQTLFVVANTTIFAAACAAASTASDEVSAYLGFIRSPGKLPRQGRLDHAEFGHDLIGATLWERPDLYLKASPVFNADKVNTPLLMLHNHGDQACDWGQSAELFQALRRLGRRAWLLGYDGEGHALAEKSSQIDFTIRLTQFFDYYLKDVSPPTWMTSGLNIDDDSKSGFILDTSGKIP